MSVSEASTTAVVAEKPSVARDIARVLGAQKKGEGFLYGNGYVVTWAVGHLVSLAQPHEMHPEWRQWRFESLPMLPESWPLVVYDKTRSQFDVVKKILNSERVSGVVCATDAGREGELIFRYIYEAAECAKPVQRLWISSMTAEAIRKGFDSLQPGANYDSLANAAHGRSRADWLVGMNLSRAYSLQYREDLSVGRVQTPTLAMLVERELTLREFVAEEYIEVLARFEGVGSRQKESYQGTWFRPREEKAAASNDAVATASESDGEGSKPGEKAEGGKETLAQLQRLPADGVEAKQIIARARKGSVAIESLRAETQRSLPPLLYDLTELQRHANRLFGFSAQETLTYAQALYERHKLISYPRTDSRHLSNDIVATLGRVAAAVGPQYPGMVAEGTGKRNPGRRFVDDSKVSDHHAILPNAVHANRNSLSEPERKIYDLVCRRFLMMWHDDFLQAVTTVITAITNVDAGESVVDRFRTSGTLVEQMGWKALDLAPEKKKKSSDDEADQVLPTDLAQGQQQRVASIDAKKKKTKPPKRFTEGTLLTAMQTAGQNLDEKELSEAMKETGLGTPATRAGIIETLLKRGYIVRSGKVLEATEKGLHLISVVHPEVKSPAMTGQWEAFLKKIHQGNAELNPFIEGINGYVSDVVGKVRQLPRAPYQPQSRFAQKPESGADTKKAPAKKSAGERAAKSPSTRKPSKSAQLTQLLKDRFALEKFPTGVKNACTAMMDGRDALVAIDKAPQMGIAAPLAALVMEATALVFAREPRAMEEQVASLKEKGIAAACIHAGVGRDESRAACVEFLGGKLSVLLLDPERLSVQGLPQMLLKRRPAFVVVEEAQQIVSSAYAASDANTLLAEHLASFRPAPTLALCQGTSAREREQIAAKMSLKLGDD